jgi:site-specific DNA-methyltransferase (adenine-specific)
MKVFEYQNHKIIKGDSLEVLSNEVADSSVDLIFVDPPYNIGKNFNGNRDKWATDDEYLHWCYTWIDLCIGKLKSNGSMYIMTSTQFMPYFDIFIRKKLTILSRLIWYYDSSGVQARKYYGSMYEPSLSIKEI